MEDLDLYPRIDAPSATPSNRKSRIAAGLREIRRDRATVLVTSSPALLAVADLVLPLRTGRVTGDERDRERVAG